MQLTEAAAYMLLGALPFIFYILSTARTQQPPTTTTQHSNQKGGKIPGSFDESASSSSSSKKNKNKKKSHAGEDEKTGIETKSATSDVVSSKSAPASIPPTTGQNKAEAAKTALAKQASEAKPKSAGAGEAKDSTKNGPTSTTERSYAASAASASAASSGKAPAPTSAPLAEAKKQDRKIIVEPKPEDGAKWLDTDEAEVLTQHRVMRIVAPKPEKEVERLPEVDGWTTVKPKAAIASAKPASSGPKPAQVVSSAPSSIPGSASYAQEQEHLTKTQRKNKKKAETAKAVKELLNQEQEERLAAHKAAQRAAGINMKYIPPPGPAPPSKWNAPSSSVAAPAASSARPTTTGISSSTARRPENDDFGDIWD